MDQVVLGLGVVVFLINFSDSFLNEEMSLFDLIKKYLFDQKVQEDGEVISEVKGTRKTLFCPPKPENILHARPELFPPKLRFLF
jgi:hypothetical protein